MQISGAFNADFNADFLYTRKAQNSAVWYVWQAPARCYDYSTYNPSSYCSSTYAGFYASSSTHIDSFQQSPLGGATAPTSHPVTVSSYLPAGEITCSSLV